MPTELSDKPHTYAPGEEPSAIRRITPESLADQCDRASTQVKGALFRLRDAADSTVTAGLELVREVRKSKPEARPEVRTDEQRAADDEFERGEDTKQFDALRPER